MSTFAVFGMTRGYALAEARKKTPIRERRKSPKGDMVWVDLSPSEWEQAVSERADRIMEGVRIVQLCKPYDTPQFAHEYLRLLKAQGECRDLCVRARSPEKDGFGSPVRNKKTGAPVLSWKPWKLEPQRAATA